MASFDVKYDKIFTLPDCIYYKSGCTFIAWEHDGKTYPIGGKAQKLSSTDGSEVVLSVKWGEEYIGRGTETAPYKVSTYEQLFNLSLFIQNGNNADAYYILTKDIDCDGKPLYPIGNGKYVFGGVFDGGGHIISNAVFESGYFDVIGNCKSLFGFIAGGTVCNLGIENYRIAAAENDYKVAPLAARVKNITNAAGDILKAATVSCVYAKGEITVNTGKFYGFAGGFIGDFDSGVMQDCYSTGNINVEFGENSFPVIGGLVASAGYKQSSLDYRTAKIIRCYADMTIAVHAVEGIIKGNAVIGGLIGQIEKAYIESSFVSGSITASGECKCFEVGHVVTVGELDTDGSLFVCLDYVITLNGENTAEGKNKYTSRENLCSAEWLENTLRMGYGKRMADF